MKRIKYLLILICSCLFLAAFDNALARVDRAVGLIQEDTTGIINDLTEIQTQEKNLQAAFETDLSQNNLALFNSNDSQVEKNIQERKSRLESINKKRTHLQEMLKELTQGTDNKNLPTDKFQDINSAINQLDQDLATYVNDYSANLALESQSFKSIANPESNYQSFFDVLKNVNTLSTTNLMNLDKVLPHFEKLNANLVNLKVDLVKLKEQKK